MNHGCGSSAAIRDDGIRRIAFYGKGGIGKSTTASNVSAAMADLGLRVMQIGCDPKADSTSLLAPGKRSKTILECIDEDRRDLDAMTAEGYGGVICAECGGPRPGTGCAGRGIIVAFEILEELGAVRTYRPDVIIYDVLGDVVCGGFAMPIRNGYAKDIFLVTSGEAMSVFAAKNIALAVDDMKQMGYARLGGIIQNSKGMESEDSLVDKAAADIGTDVLIRIPRSGTVHECESEGTTVIQGRPNSAQAACYRRLASEILARTEGAAGCMRQE
ncbi:MAG: AAA family ATPase [Candidatus Methanoplasma sp.]|jgi:nitrogenase iron protein NifH|nr:AAA family ATPase [Candidatus Methanoplasma sp.]